MNTLIIYATKHGTTGACAKKLSEKLKGKVDLHNLRIGSIPDLAKYDKVIIGGSIYAGRIQKEVSEFSQKNLNELKGKKIGLFICCMIEKSAEMQLNASFPKELLDSAVAKESFGGELKFSDMSFGEKVITKMVAKMLSKSGDSSGEIDMKKDKSMICEESITRFAQLMNNA